MSNHFLTFPLQAGEQLYTRVFSVSAAQICRGVEMSRGSPPPPPPLPFALYHLYRCTRTQHPDWCLRIFVKQRQTVICESLELIHDPSHHHHHHHYPHAEKPEVIWRNGWETEPLWLLWPWPVNAVLGHIRLQWLCGGWNISKKEKEISFTMLWLNKRWIKGSFCCC